MMKRILAAALVISLLAITTGCSTSAASSQSEVPAPGELSFASHNSALEESAPDADENGSMSLPVEGGSRLTENRVGAAVRHPPG